MRPPPVEFVDEEHGQPGWHPGADDGACFGFLNGSQRQRANRQRVDQCGATAVPVGMDEIKIHDGDGDGDVAEREVGPRLELQGREPHGAIRMATNTTTSNRSTNSRATATATATRVLPTPPTQWSVTSRPVRRNGGNAIVPTWNKRSGLVKSFRWYSPRSVRSSPSSNARVMADTRICPP